MVKLLGRGCLGTSSRDGSDPDIGSDFIAGVHSPLELRYFRDVERKHGLLPGDRQVLVTRGAARQYLDVRYSDYGVVVELGGVLAHSPQNSNRDARRDNANTLDGYRTLRYSWVPVAYHPCETAQQVFELLRRNGYRCALHRCGKNCEIRWCLELCPEPEKGRPGNW